MNEISSDVLNELFVNVMNVLSINILPCGFNGLNELSFNGLNEIFVNFSPRGVRDSGEILSDSGIHGLNCLNSLGPQSSQEYALSQT